MSRANRSRILWSLAGGALLAAVLTVGCAPASSSKDAMTEKPTPTVEAMMAKESATPDAMMKKESATPDAMMKKDSATPDAMMMKDMATPDAMMMDKKLPAQIAAPHFVDSSPTQGQTLSQMPQVIVINFNFTLHENSRVVVMRDGAAVTTDRTTIDSNRLTLRTPRGSVTGDGTYTVSYKACWPDGSCHDGQFGFVVDSKVKTSYLDMTGRAEIAMSMEGVNFGLPQIVVSKGTKMTWTNRDPVAHFVNTDPHPSHNLLPSLNSLAINQGESYSFTFTQAGEWPYHCSAHVPSGMVASVVVAN